MIKNSKQKIAWRGKDGKYRVIEYPYDKGRMTVHSKAPADATIVKDARSAFDAAKLFYGKAPSVKLVSQMKKDRLQEAEKMGVTGQASIPISKEPAFISRKPPRISR